MAPRTSHLNTPLNAKLSEVAQHRLGFNADAVAIVLALTLAALIRFNVIHHIGW